MTSSTLSTSILPGLNDNNPNTWKTWHPFYPISSNLRHFEQIIDFDFDCIQIRVKNLDYESSLNLIQDVSEIYQRSLKANKKPKAIFINDYWQAVLTSGCRYCHLGQEDSAKADINQLHKHNVNLGISTHTSQELAFAEKLKPFYFALGPIYKTSLKKMKYPPQGLKQLKTWKAQNPNQPLIAIGGLNKQKAKKCLNHGADLCCVVSDIHPPNNTIRKTEQWLNINKCQ